MDDDMRERDQQPAGERRRWARSAALVGSGLVAGGILAGTLTANAADEAATSTDGTAVECPGGRGGGPHGDEQTLTGDTAASVTEAVLAEHPDATIRRLETDSDGVYEAHILTADDERLTVELDESFVITSTERHDGARPGRGHGDKGNAAEDRDRDDGITDEVEPTR